MRVLVCGGRDYRHPDIVWRRLDGILRNCPPNSMLVIQGGATGADEHARRWCIQHAVPCLIFPADWGRHGRAAGPIRNALMIEHGKPDLVIGFPGGAGTADMLTRAKAAGLHVVKVDGIELETVAPGGSK